MNGWLVVPWPDQDRDRIHVVPEKHGEPDPIHDPSPDCACQPRIVADFDLSGQLRQLVIHSGPN
mgnify:CR=1 FL=1